MDKRFIIALAVVVALVAAGFIIGARLIMRWLVG
jgi:hypothetical protein